SHPRLGFAGAQGRLEPARLHRLEALTLAPPDAHVALSRTAPLLDARQVGVDAAVVAHGSRWRRSPGASRISERLHLLRRQRDHRRAVGSGWLVGSRRHAALPCIVMKCRQRGCYSRITARGGTFGSIEPSRPGQARWGRIVCPVHAAAPPHLLNEVAATPTTDAAASETAEAARPRANRRCPGPQGEHQGSGRGSGPPRPRALPQVERPAAVPAPEHHHLPGWVRREFARVRPPLGDLLVLLEPPARDELRSRLDELTAGIS